MYGYGDRSQHTASHCCAQCGQPLSDERSGVAIEGVGLVTYNGKQARLSYAEAEMLRVLRRSFGRTVHREVIYNALYEDAEVSDKIIDVYACKLRGKLAPLGLRIVNTRAVGYALKPASMG